MTDPWNGNSQVFRTYVKGDTDGDGKAPAAKTKLKGRKKIAELDLIEKNIKDYFDGNGTGYKAELIKHGDWINHVDERTDDFINTYGV